MTNMRDRLRGPTRAARPHAPAPPISRKKRTAQSTKNSTSTGTPTSSEKPRPHVCDAPSCGKAFLSKNDLRKHSLIHLGVKPFGCEQCGRCFRQAGNLRNHITSHHSSVVENATVFVCDHCGKPFLIKERLRLHLRTHTGLKPYNCPQCPAKFARLGQLKQHGRVHSGERAHSCSHCGATFTCAGKLRLHARRHQDRRDYTCYLCGKRFLRPDSIKKHLRCYHDGEKPFQCGICNKRLKGHLQEHLRTHEAARPHGCPDCGGRFAQRSQLVVHQRTHSGARPYRCPVCWRAFSHSTALKLHVRRHTGEKPFQCPMCSATFSQLPHKKKHVYCIHGEKRSYNHPPCGALFKMKHDLDKHIATCTFVDASDNENLSTEEQLSRRVADAYKSVDPPMALTKMRLLLAVLLKKISSSKRLDELVCGVFNCCSFRSFDVVLMPTCSHSSSGFNKRLIDDILTESLESSGHSPMKDQTMSCAERLRYNVQLLLEWTIPPHFMKRFREERRSTEELLEELTS